MGKDTVRGIRGEDKRKRSLIIPQGRITEPGEVVGGVRESEGRGQELGGSPTHSIKAGVLVGD